jgi:hypothetical protein
MTARIRFGLHDGEAVVRARTAGTPPDLRTAWERWFPTGWWLSVGGLDYRAIGNTTGTTNALTGRTFYDHPEQGIRALAVDGLADGITPYLHVQNDDGADWDAEQELGPAVWHYTDCANRIDAGNTQGIAVEWLNNGAVDPDDYATALSIAQDTMDFLDGHVDQALAWRISDDVQIAMPGGAQKVVTMARAIQDADPHHRPCPIVVVDPDVWDLYPAGDLRLAITYRYPHAYRFGDPQPEGDYHNWVGLADYGGGGEDWVDALREWTNELPAGVPCWLILQAFPSEAQPTTYRPPTTRELRKSFWIAVGEGFKGIWWFTANANPDESVGWTGINDYALQPASDVIGELHRRLTPEIRARLLRADRVADLFAVTGGATSGYIVDYDAAYVSTLEDRHDGTRYAVVCNHNTATENVTISSATLTGAIENLETGVRTTLPATVSLPALDGSIYRFVVPEPGVPRAVLDASLSPEEWWARCWANPDSPYYVSYDAIVLHPRTVNVGTLDDLQTVLDAAPDNTTLVLPADYTFADLNITGRNGIHIVAADPDNPWVCTGYVGMYANATAESSIASWTTAVLSDSPAGSEALFLNPPRDFILRDGAFTHPGPFIARPPIHLQGVADVLIERVVMTGHVCPDAGGGGTGAPVGHPGLVTGAGGVENVVVRESTLTGFTNPGGFGYPTPVYWDGPRGCVFVDNTTNGKWFNRTGPLWLTNDDFTLDYDGDRTIHRWREERSAQFNASVGNTCSGNSFFMSVTGGYNLIAENDISGLSGGNLATVIEIVARCSRLHEHPYNHRYFHYDTIVRDNIIHGNVLESVIEHQPDPGFVCFDQGDPRNTAAYAWRSRVGRTTLTGTRVTGTVADWIIDEPSSSAASDGPNVESGNQENWVP